MPATMFPQRLDAPQAYGIAKAMMDGFNRHYRLFRTESARAKHRFETADWHGQQRAQRERIEFYDLRVKECVRRLEKEFEAGAQPMDVWHQVKLHYIGLLVNHHQPELGILHALGNQRVRAYHQVNIAFGNCFEHAATLFRAQAAGEQRHAHACAVKVIFRHHTEQAFQLIELGLVGACLGIGGRGGFV
jgi:isocitrate dehydrogenase kinase/phosphatase